MLWREPSLSPIVLGFTTAVSIATGLIFGLAPALTTVRSIPQDHLREGAGTSTPAALRPRHALVFAQVALASVLLAGAGDKRQKSVRSRR